MGNRFHGAFDSPPRRRRRRKVREDCGARRAGPYLTTDLSAVALGQADLAKADEHRYLPQGIPAGLRQCVQNTKTRRHEGSARNSAGEGSRPRLAPFRALVSLAPFGSRAPDVLVNFVHRPSTPSRRPGSAQPYTNHPLLLESKWDEGRPAVLFLAQSRKGAENAEPDRQDICILNGIRAGCPRLCSRFICIARPADREHEVFAALRFPPSPA